MSEFREYLDKAGNLPADVLLGKIVLFTITDEPVAHADLERWFTELNLDKALMPHPIREMDAFKKATSEAKGTYPMSHNRDAFLLCRDVQSTNDYVKRQITREIKDSRNIRLSYASAIDCTFFKATRSGSGRMQINIRSGDIEAQEVADVERVAKEIANDYHRFVNFHDGQKLRGVVRNYVRHLNGIEVKGGVYFVHQSKDDELQRLAELVRRFGGGCMLQTIPMVDLEQDRQFIASVFEREACENLEGIARDVAALMGDRQTITDAAYNKLKARFDETLVEANEHMVNLRCTQDLTAAAAEVALAAIQKLQVAMVTAA